MSIGLVAVISFGWFGVIFWVMAILRTAGRQTPAPPARPRARLVQSRERAGVVEFLPASGDAQNGRKAARR